MSTAVLGIEVKSDSVKQGAADLDKFAVSATEAEVAAVRASKNTTAALVQQSSVSLATARSSYARATASLAALRASETATKEEIAAAAAGRVKEAASLAAAQAQYQEARAAAAVAAANEKATATAWMAAAALEAEAIAARTDSIALRTVETGALLSGNQISELGHIMRSTAGTMLAGGSAFQALGFEANRLVSVFSIGEGGIGGTFKALGGILSSLVGKFWPVLLVVGAIATAFIGLQHEIQHTTGVAVTFGDVALAIWQTVRDGVYNLLKPTIDAIAPWFASAWELVIVYTKEVGNFIINAFRVAFVTIEFGVKALPDAFIVAGQAAAQGFIDAMVSMAREVVVIINGTIAKINGLLKASGIGTQLGMLGAPTEIIPRAVIDIGGDAAMDRIIQRADELKKIIQDIQNSDPLGSFYTSVQEHALENAKNRLKEVAGTAKDAGNAIHNAANDNIAAWQQLNRNIEAAKGVTNGFLTDIRQGLKDGEGFWASFQKAGTNAIDRIADHIQENLVDALFAPAQQGGGGIFAWLAKLMGAGAPTPVAAGLFAQGAAFSAGNVIPFRQGGVVSAPTLFPMARGMGLMGEAGPEAVMPLRRGADGRLGVAAQAGSPASNVVTLNVNVHGARGDAAIEEHVQAGVTAALSEYDKTIPAKVGNTLRKIAPKPIMQRS